MAAKKSTVTNSPSEKAGFVTIGYTNNNEPVMQSPDGCILIIPNFYKKNTNKYSADHVAEVVYVNFKGKAA